MPCVVLTAGPQEEHGTQEGTEGSLRGSRAPCPVLPWPPRLPRLPVCLGVWLRVTRLRAAGLQPGLSPARHGAIPQVYQLGGICKLVDLLRSPNQNVQQAAAGALRNLVFRSTTNKLETRRQNGIREAVSLLRRTGSTEIQKQLTGGGLAAGAGVGAAGGRDRVRAGGGLGRTPLESHRPVLARLVVPSWCPGYWAPLCAHRPSVWSEVSEERGQCVQVESVFGETETGRRPQGVGALAQPLCPVDPHREAPVLCPRNPAANWLRWGRGAQGRGQGGRGPAGRPWAWSC